MNRELVGITTALILILLIVNSCSHGRAKEIDKMVGNSDLCGLPGTPDNCKYLLSFDVDWDVVDVATYLDPVYGDTLRMSKASSGLEDFYKLKIFFKLKDGRKFCETIDTKSLVNKMKKEVDVHQLKRRIVATDDGTLDEKNSSLGGAVRLLVRIDKDALYLNYEIFETLKAKVRILEDYKKYSYLIYKEKLDNLVCENPDKKIEKVTIPGDHAYSIHFSKDHKFISNKSRWIYNDNEKRSWNSGRGEYDNFYNLTLDIVTNSGDSIHEVIAIKDHVIELIKKHQVPDMTRLDARRGKGANIRVYADKERVVGVYDVWKAFENESPSSWQSKTYQYPLFEKRIGKKKETIGCVWKNYIQFGLHVDVDYDSVKTGRSIYSPKDTFFRPGVGVVGGVIYRSMPFDDVKFKYDLVDGKVLNEYINIQKINKIILGKYNQQDVANIYAVIATLFVSVSKDRLVSNYEVREIYHDIDSNNDLVEKITKYPIVDKEI